VAHHPHCARSLRNTLAAHTRYLIHRTHLRTSNLLLSPPPSLSPRIEGGSCVTTRQRCTPRLVPQHDQDPGRARVAYSQRILTGDTPHPHPCRFGTCILQASTTSISTPTGIGRLVVVVPASAGGKVPRAPNTVNFTLSFQESKCQSFGKEWWNGRV